MVARRQADRVLGRRFRHASTRSLDGAASRRCADPRDQRRRDRGEPILVARRPLPVLLERSGRHRQPLARPHRRFHGCGHPAARAGDGTQHQRRARQPVEGRPASRLRDVHVEHRRLYGSIRSGETAAGGGSDLAARGIASLDGVAGVARCEPARPRPLEPAAGSVSRPHARQRSAPRHQRPAGCSLPGVVTGRQADRLHAQPTDRRQHPADGCGLRKCRTSRDRKRGRIPRLSWLVARREAHRHRTGRAKAGRVHIHPGGIRVAGGIRAPARPAHRYVHPALVVVGRQEPGRDHRLSRDDLLARDEKVRGGYPGPRRGQRLGTRTGFPATSTSCSSTPPVPI